MNDYSQDIYNILLRAPEGLSIRKIVRHVFNMHNTLFETAELEEVKKNVTQFLLSRAKSRTSPIENTGTRGVYRLKPDSDIVRQLQFEFTDNVEDMTAEGAPDSESVQELSLFEF